MATSLFDSIMTDSAIPALQDVFGVDAVHTNSDADESDVVVLLQSEYAPVGEFGERMEQRWTLEIPTASGAVIGDTFTIENDPTDDDPDPDPTIWQAIQLIADDGYLRKFAVMTTT